MPQGSADGFEPTLRALGGLIVNFNSVDHTLRRIAWLLIDQENERIGQVVVDALGSAKLEDLVTALFPLRIADAAARDLFDDAIKECRAVRDIRNRYVHAVWRVPNEATDLAGIEAVKAPTRKKDEYGVVDSSGSADQLRAVSKRASTLEAVLATCRRLRAK